MPDVWGAPGYDPVSGAGFVRKWSGVDRENIDPNGFGVDALCAARLGATWTDDLDHPITGAMIGGFVEAVQVTRSGAKRQLLATWPDRPGTFIDRTATCLPSILEPEVRSRFAAS